MLDVRRIAVLRALVEEYVVTGEPVSSQAILDRSGLAVSSATIRNDLSKLESYGFVEQPHTSAGRIPTQPGYRYYVDNSTPGTLRRATRSRIESFFADVDRQLSGLLKDTSGLLTDLSTYPAIVIGPGFAGETVRAFHLLQIAPAAMLAVTVSNTGRVSQDVVSVSGSVTNRHMEEAEQILARALDDATIQTGLESLAALPVDLIADDVLDVINAVGGTLRGLEQRTKDVYIGGTTRLTNLWQDLAHVQTILTLLEHDTGVRQILGGDEGTSVRLSSDLDLDEIDVAVVSTPFDAGENATGRIGVLGPMRMEYRRTIKIVEEVSESLGDNLGR